MIKNVFNKTQNIKSLGDFTQKSASLEDFTEFESYKYVEEISNSNKTNYSDIDFSDYSNFVKFGSAKKYFENITTKVTDLYPYDGSKAEKLKFYNQLSQYEQYELDTNYPSSTGYLSFGSDWGATSTVSSGYGSSSIPEYVRFFGGANIGNVYDESKNLENNLKVDFSEGFTIEFWMQKTRYTDPTTETEKEVIYHLSDVEKYRRFAIYLKGNVSTTSFFVDYQIGDGSGASWTAEIYEPISASATTLADDAWHHYALTIATNSAGYYLETYKDGVFFQKNDYAIVSPTTTITGSLIGTIGSLGYSFGGLTGIGYGKIIADFDEFRIWKERRTAKDIYENYFCQVGGGTNTDFDKNLNLALYYKFNEGITGDSEQDSVILDYSGRLTNGILIGDSSTCRSTGSALVEMFGTEERDPIIYYEHPDVLQYLTDRLDIAESYDSSNSSCILNNLPSWIMEEDDETQTLANFLHIIGSYFDSLYAQISGITTQGEVSYTINKKNQYISSLLSSYGFDFEDFLNSFEDFKLNQNLDKDNTIVYEEKLQDIKNEIYKNIYNNLVYIGKSKGTEKSFRNLLRCFGIDENVVELNYYTEGAEYELRNQRVSKLIPKSYIDFTYGNSTTNRNGNVYQYYADADPDYIGYISGSLYDDLPLSVECNISFPADVYLTENKVPLIDEFSIFGCHSLQTPGSSNVWKTTNDYNFHVYVRKNYNDIQFVLSSSMIPGEISSSYFENGFKNDNWTLNVQIYKTKDNLFPSSSAYTLELNGVRPINQSFTDSFTISSSVSYATGSQFLATNAKSVFAGAHLTDYVTTVLMDSNIKLYSLRAWLCDTDLDEVENRALDVENLGKSADLLYYYGKTFNIPKYDTNIFDWTFDTVEYTTVGSTAVVEDCSFGSDKYGSLSNILNNRHPGLINGFLRTQCKRRDYLETFQITNPDKSNDSSGINISYFDDLTFEKNPNSKNNMFITVESSMYEKISERMLSLLNSREQFSDFIAPIDRYRQEYKAMSHFRKLFFEKADAIADFDRYLDVYRVIESAINSIISNLFPVSANSNDTLSFILESHAFEKNKIAYIPNSGSVDTILKKTGTSVSLNIPNVLIVLNNGLSTKYQNFQTITDFVKSNYDPEILGLSVGSSVLIGSFTQYFGYYSNTIVPPEGSTEEYSRYIAPNANTRMEGVSIRRRRGRNNMKYLVDSSARFTNENYLEQITINSEKYSSNSYSVYVSGDKNVWWQNSAERHNSQITISDHQTRIQIHDNARTEQLLERDIACVVKEGKTGFNVNIFDINNLEESSYSVLKIKQGRYLHKTISGHNAKNILTLVKQ